MCCPYKNKLKGYLEETLVQEEMQEIEKHIDFCTECQEELDRLMDEPLKLQREVLDVSDEVLVEKIKARKKGIRRIFCYGILGFVLGLFSRFYTSDSFIVTKAIMALPYKLGEFALGIFFSKNKLPLFYQGRIAEHSGIGFFPFNPILDFIVGMVTPAIIATFIAITLGYLVSDKRVFQRKKLIRFLLLGLLVFVLWSGVLQAVYMHTLAQIEKLKDIREVTVYIVEEESTSWLIQIDEESSSNKEYAALFQGLSHLEKADIHLPQEKIDMKLLISLGGGGQIEGDVSLKEGIMQMQNGSTYRLSAAAVEGLQKLMEGGK